ACHRLFGAPTGSSPALAGQEREYYDRWFRLVSIDIWEMENAFSRVLNPSTLELRIDEGVTIPLKKLELQTDPHAVHIGSDLENESSVQRPQVPHRQADSRAVTPGGFAFVLGTFADPETASDVTPGEELIVHRGDPCAWEAFRAWVTRLHEDRILLRFRVPLHISRDTALNGTPPPGGEAGWFLDRLPFSRPREAARRGLFEFLARARRPVIDVVARGAKEDSAREDSSPGHPDNASCTEASSKDATPAPTSGSAAVKGWSDASPDLDDLCFSEGLTAELNEDQEEAIKAALTSETCHLIHGPPGTGKTRVLARLIRLCLDRGERVLVACPTNVALDGLLLSVMDLGVREFLRIGRRSGVSRAFLDAVERIGSPPTLLNELAAIDMSFGDFRRRVKLTQLVGATAYQCATHPFFLKQRFDRVVIDEAGQLDEPSTLAPLAVSDRFVLGGDHLQLPPIVRVRTADSEREESPGLEQSLFERLLGALPGAGISRLNMQYRMNREVQDIPSRLFYGGALYPSPEAGSRRLCIEPGVSSVPEVNEIVSPDSPVVFVDVEGPNGGRARPEEAEAAGTIFESLVAGGVPPSEVGIITPYRAQQALIRKRLSRGRGTASPSVDTVDRFQGGEREVIILSLSRSDEVTSFLADKKRLNVSLSRARSKLILLGHGRTLDGHPLFASILEGVKRVRLCPGC
ncbi:MAG: AAA domain-containing protein, partial [Pseudomonadota bacterium]